MKAKILSLIILLLPIFGYADDLFRIDINDQSQFNNLNRLISKSIGEDKKNIIVTIHSGTYYYKENHLAFVNIDRPDVSIRIKGDDAILISSGNDYISGDQYKEGFSPASAFVDLEEMKAYDFFDDCRFADKMVEVVDKEKGLCRIPYSRARNTEEEECCNMFVIIPQWYKSSTYKVTKIDNGYIYFLAEKLEYLKKRGREEYTVNYDYLFGGQKTRFMLCNPTDPSRHIQITNGIFKSKSGKIHECEICRFLRAENASLKDLRIEGLHFLGNKDNNNYLMSFTKVKTEDVTISNCTFNGIHSRIVFAHYTPNLTFRNNHVSNCYHNGVESTNSCPDTKIINNTFRNCGRSMNQVICVNCKGTNYHIGNNSFINFSYAAIGVGVWYRSNKQFTSSGIVEYNHIYYEGDYLSKPERYTLMDSGAIYLWTQNDKAIIRYNYIHDYIGMAENRGIFADDGAYNFEIYGNIIINMKDTSIDSRNCQTYYPEGNQNIIIRNNIVDCPIKFEGSDKQDNNCIRSGNILLYKKGTSIPVNIYSNLYTEKEDSKLQCIDWDEKGIIVNKSSYKKLQSRPYFKNIEQYIRIK